MSNYILKNNNKPQENESKIYEYNNLYIEGFHFKCSLSKILEDFEKMGLQTQAQTTSLSLLPPPSSEDLYEKTIEEEIDELINQERLKIMKKKIFNLHKDNSKINVNENLDYRLKCNSLYSNQNHLRNEAKIVEESIKKVKVKDYNMIVKEKFRECKLLSYYFYTNYYNKKEVGKENNYIFNFSDNFLNDMSNIDRSFFLEFFQMINPFGKELFKNEILLFDNKSNDNINFQDEELVENENEVKYCLNMNNDSDVYLNKDKEKVKFFKKDKEKSSFLTYHKQDKQDNIDNTASTYSIFPKLIHKKNNEKTIFPNNSLELIYSFSIYHPLKNTKSQQIEVLGSSTLCQLKDKIYCVIEEIDDHYKNKTLYTNPNSDESLKRYGSFLYIESNFYNDVRKTNLNLSNKIIKARNEKRNFSTTYSNNDYQYTNKLNFNSTSSYSINMNSTQNQYFQYGGQLCHYGQEQQNNNNPHEIKNVFDYYNQSLYCYDFLNYNSSIYQEIRMDGTRIDHIVMRIGYPYLYRHQEYCDHMVILTDIRVFDIYDYNSFISKDGVIENSIVSFQKKLKRRLCDLCGYYYSK